MHRQDKVSEVHGRLHKREALSLFAEDLRDHSVAAAAKWSKSRRSASPSPGRRARQQTTFHVLCLPQYLEYSQRINSP
jgi:hypothetical protein